MYVIGLFFVLWTGLRLVGPVMSRHLPVGSSHSMQMVSVSILILNFWKGHLRHYYLNFICLKNAGLVQECVTGTDSTFVGLIHAYLAILWVTSISHLCYFGKVIAISSPVSFFNWTPIFDHEIKRAVIFNVQVCSWRIKKNLSRSCMIRYNFIVKYSNWKTIFKKLHQNPLVFIANKTCPLSLIWP